MSHESAGRTTPPVDSNETTVATVRDRYGRIAEGTLSGCCGPAATAGCGSSEETAARAIGYSEADLTTLQEAANLGLGCGAPVALLDLQPGETVVNLGSGPGLDALLAARRVGPGGRVIGIDMTQPMLERARAAAAELGATQVEFREGRLEALPVADATADAITSNCVINLVPDKPAVFREIARVLRPGGRLVVSDIVLDGPLPEVVAHDTLAYVGCVSGAVLRSDYFAMIEAAGLGMAEILTDFDYLAKIGNALPEELLKKMSDAGVAASELAGKVRSITYRAVKPAPAA